MQINRNNDGSVIQCMISKEELASNGLDIDLIKTDEDTRNNIVSTVLEVVAQNVPVDFNDMLNPIGLIVTNDDLLVVEIKFKHTEKSDEKPNFLDFLKDLVDNLLDENEEDLNNLESHSVEFYESENDDLSALLALKSLDEAILFAHKVNTLLIPCSTLYKYKDTFYLYMNFNCSDDSMLEGLYRIMLEYSYNDASMYALDYLVEHAKCIIDINAIDSLQRL